MSVLAFPMPTPPACAVCGGGQLDPVEQAAGHPLVECARCRVWSVHPVPSREQLEAAYDEDYYVPWRSEAGARRRMWRRRLRLLRDAKRGRLLDVGCAEGSFIAQARDAGFAVEGTELSAHGARRTARGLGVPVFHGELVEAGYPACSFAVVTIWHVLEHMLHPGEALAEARRILEPDGTLVVAVPNRDNPVFRAAYRLARRRPLHLYHPDDREQHLHHWNPAALAVALELAGFDLLSIVPDPCATGLVKGIVDRVGRIHSWLAGTPRTSAMVALAAPSKET